MTEDYYLLHMTGVKQSAEVFLKGLLDGRHSPYFSAEHDDIEVTADGDRAKMTGKSRAWLPSTAGGNIGGTCRVISHSGKNRANGNEQFQSFDLLREVDTRKRQP